MEALGRTLNTHYYLLAEDVLIVLPDKGLKDDGPSAQVNIDYQTAYARRLGADAASSSSSIR